MSDNILTCPDESGWYWFKSRPSARPQLIFVNDDGVGFYFDDDVCSYELEDLKGQWEVAEPNEL